jgi:hypothetical protein
MKQTLLIIILSFAHLNLTAKNDTFDEISYSQIDTICIDNIDSCDFKDVETVKIFDNKKQKKAINTAKIKALGLGDFFSDIWDDFTSLFKPVWGYYEENGMRNEGPYFLFNREGDKLNTQIEKIRIQINSSDKMKELYGLIVASAGTTTIDNCNGVIIPNPLDGSKLCEAAKRAKASAFVYIVGLDASGNELSEGDRNGYRDRALGYLKDVKIQGLNNALDYLSYIPLLDMLAQRM